MIDPRTLRGQLALAYAIALLVALVAFAVVTLALVDRTQRSTLDERLQIATRAISALSDTSHGRLVFDVSDQAQFARIVGTRLDGAILKPKGQTIFSTVVAIPDAVRALALDGGPPRVQTVRTSEAELRVSVLPVPAGEARIVGVAMVWRDLDGIGELDRRLALIFALVIPLVAAFAIVGGSAVAARGLRPLGVMATLAAEIEARDLSRRLAIPPRDAERGRLVVTFDRMLDRLEAAFERQRRFTSDASHELRAPLSVIRAEADLALRHPRSRSEYERALRAIAAQADDLEALTRDLLAAARAESGSANDARVADMAAVAARAAQRLDALARAREITVRQSADRAVGVRGDGAALGRALLCLVHNALKYARRGGAVDIRVVRDGDRVRVAVTDDGPGFSREALARATERFWRDDPARQRADGTETGGTGLGLSIAAAIIDAAHGSLLLTNGPTGGAVVTIVLPTADPFMPG
ncbi:MAG: hypothetical protein NVS3B7_12450 [Candidatus Elarobacter sp.]